MIKAYTLRLCYNWLEELELTESSDFTMGPDDLERVYDENGVDLSLIRWMLSLSMEERLQTLQDHANAMLAIRDEITINTIY